MISTGIVILKGLDSTGRILVAYEDARKIKPYGYRDVWRKVKHDKKGAYVELDKIRYYVEI